MRARTVFAVAYLLASASELCFGQDASSQLTALVHDVLQPYASATPAGSSEATKRAAEILKDQHLIGSSRPSILASGLIDQYARPLALGTRAANFTADIAAIHEAFQHNDLAAVRQAILTLSQHAGRTEPDSKTLAKIVAALKEIESTGDGKPIEHATIEQPDRSIDISWSKPDGKVKVDVIDRKGPDGHPVRTTFEGDAITRADSASKTLELAGKPDGKPPREITQEKANKLREKLNGEWIDQDGNTWILSGTDASLTGTKIQSGHPVPYNGKFELGRVTGEHIINDPADITEGFPEEIKQQLASKYHPPYKISLDANDAGDRLEGRWTSMHVTYGSLDLSISKVGDPYDLPLILTRKLTSGIALGMKDGDFP